MSSDGVTKAGVGKYVGIWRRRLNSEGLCHVNTKRHSLIYSETNLASIFESE